MGYVRKTAGNIVKHDFWFVPLRRIYFFNPLSDQKMEEKSIAQAIQSNVALIAAAHRPQIYPD